MSSTVRQTLETAPDTTSMSANAGMQPIVPIYVFLSALVLFLCLSIVTSSLLLRRRRVIEESIRNVVIRPNMFGVSLTVSPGSGSACAYGKKEDVHWETILPFSAAYVPPQHDLLHPPFPTIPRTSGLGFCFPAHRNVTLTPSLPIVSPLTMTHLCPNRTQWPNPSPPPPSTLRVIVLIAMPSLGLSEKDGVREESLPHVEFGVVEAPIVG